VESKLRINLALGVAEVREGECDLRITDCFRSQWLKGLVVEPNQTLNETVIVEF
jgi:hypothetical protein